jgi:hypothetical protein
MGNKSSLKPDSKAPKKTLTEAIDEKLIRKISKRWENIRKRYGLTFRGLEKFKESHPDKFKRYLEEGPPEDMRWLVWKVALDSARVLPLDMSAHEDHLCIEKDIERTFPNHKFFSRSKNREALKNVLLSLVNYHPELGYCQGMNSLAGVFLIVTNDQAESLGMLDRLCFALGGKSLFEYEFPLVGKSCQEFHRVLECKMPEVSRFLKDIDFDDHLWLTKWFMTIFSHSFHFKCVVRIWDNIFANGLNFMINVALGLVETIKSDLLGKSFQDMLEFLPLLKEEGLDIDLVLFNSVKFQVRPVLQDFPVRSYSISQEVDENETIQTNWESRQVIHTKSIIEEFSESISNNISKFSI